MRKSVFKRTGFFRGQPTFPRAQAAYALKRESMSKVSAESVKPDDEGNKPAGVLAFYSQKEHTGPKIELWINTNEKPGAPDFDGALSGKRIGAYFRQGRKGNFIAIFDSTQRADGKHDQLGTAQVVSNIAGVPKLAITFEGSTAWAEVSRKVPEAMLVQCGLDLGKQSQKKKAYAAKKTQSPSDEA